MRFASMTPDTPELTEILYFGFTKDELMRIAEGLGVAIVAILVILLVIRPLINNAFETTSTGSDKLLSGNAEDDNLLLSNFLKKTKAVTNWSTSTRLTAGLRSLRSKSLTASG